MATREEIYDEKLNPLMGRIIDICKEHDIPFVASFQLDDDRSVPDLFCTSAIIPVDGAEELKTAYATVRRSPRNALQITTTKADGSKIITRFLG